MAMAAAAQSGTSRGRWLAAMEFQPVDRLPYWPKLAPNYASFQQGAFAAMSADELAEYVGFDRVTFLPTGVRDVYAEGFGLETHRDGPDIRTIYRTPNGTCEDVYRWDEDSASWHPMTHAIHGPEDLDHMTAWYAAYRAEPDEEGLAEAARLVERVGDASMTAAVTMKSPLLCFIEHLAGVAEGHYLLPTIPRRSVGCSARSSVGCSIGWA